jgi:hypothetical protein
MTVQRATGMASGPGGRSLQVGPDQPDPFVKGLGTPEDPDGSGTAGVPDEPDPFATGLADTDRPAQ